MFSFIFNFLLIIIMSIGALVIFYPGTYDKLIKHIGLPTDMLIRRPEDKNEEYFPQQFLNIIKEGRLWDVMKNGPQNLRIMIIAYPLLILLYLNYLVCLLF